MRVSVTSLSLVNECPRCLWLSVRMRRSRPSMFSSLPGGLHKNIEKEVEVYAWRGEKPPWMQHIRGKLLTVRKKLEYDFDGITLVGILDDLMKVDTGGYMIIDYKTSRAPYDQSKAEKYYGLQMDCYALLLEENGYSPVNEAVLIFFTPSLTGMGHDIMETKIPFQVHTVRMAADSLRAHRALVRAREVVMHDREPMPSKTCPWCNY